ncbi:MAG: methyl-accepting chemotaxis protein [Desulfomonilaceae bacterium]|nr:methyl-accepting chemotaxis protein [Desulfomonilaceae bacterium]
MLVARVGLMAKSMVGSLLPIALVMALSVIGYVGIVQLESVVTVAERNSRVITHMTAALTAGLEARSALRARESKGNDSASRQYEVSGDITLSMLARAKEVAVDGQTIDRVDEAAREFRSWREQAADFSAAPRNRAGDHYGRAELGSWASERSRHFDAFKKAAADAMANEEAVLKDLRETAVRDSDLARKAILILALSVIAAAFTKNYVLATKTTQPLLAAVDLAEAIGRGDLSREPIEVKGSDEVGRLGAALNAMLDGLKRQAISIRDGVIVSLKSAEKISSTVSDLSTATSRTAAALTEATTTVEQVRQAANVSSVKAKNVAAASQEAVRISESGLSAAEESARKISLVQKQMEAIGETVLKLSENAQAIEDVADVVKDLANQSNVLAVNASIEAARAGAQGKGFGVVAHEIRILSEGSKEAVDNVRTILEDVRQSIGAVVMAMEDGKRSVAEGVTQSAAAGKAIRELAERVEASSQAATVIEVSGEQQFIAMDQVATAMEDIRKAVDENLENSSRLETSVKELNQLGANLKQILRLFKL